MRAQVCRPLCVVMEYSKPARGNRLSGFGKMEGIVEGEILEGAGTVGKSTEKGLIVKALLLCPRVP